MGSDLTRLERADVIAVIMDGDLSRLNDEQRAWYYVHECGRMGLDPAARPLEWTRLQGKLTLYAKRVAGDMLAAKHRVSGKIVEGPEVRDFGGVKLIYARAVVAMPDGRSMEDVGTLPTQDMVNGIMKVCTKALRRATLRLCGWGGLDESELETVRGVQAFEAAPTVRQLEAPPRLSPHSDARIPDSVEADIDEFRTDEADGESTRLTLEQAAAIWCDHRPDLSQEEQSAVMDRLQRCAHAKSAELQRAFAAEERKRSQASSSDPIVEYEQFYAKARSKIEVRQIDEEVKGLGLASDSPDRARLLKARNDALARLSPRKPPDGPRGGAPKPVPTQDTTAVGDVYQTPDMLAAAAPVDTEVERLRAAISEVTQLDHVVNRALSDDAEHSYRVEIDTLKRVVGERAAQLGRGYQAGVNAVTAALHKRHGKAAA